MYSVHDYGRMIVDEVRMAAYVAALRAAVKPGSVVIDLGAGTGIFCLYACRFGAKKVYAIETNDAIDIARKVAAANGYADRIEFIQALSTEVELPERADVIVSDLRGSLPLFGQHLESLFDAKTRLLAPGGVLIPMEDDLVASLVEVEDLHDQVLTPWVSPLDGFDLSAGLPAVTSGVHQDKIKLTEAQLLTPPRTWASITYGRSPPPVVAGRLRVEATRSGTAHGVALWFDAKLGPGVGFTNAPGSTAIYGRSLYAFPHAVRVEAGEEISIDLVARKTADDYLWSLVTEIGGVPGKPRAELRQSSWLTLPARRALPSRARLGKRGRLAFEVLRAMDGTADPSAIVDRVFENFPETFGTDREAASALVRRIVADYADLDDALGPNRER